MIDHLCKRMVPFLMFFPRITGTPLICKFRPYVSRSSDFRRNLVEGNPTPPHRQLRQPIRHRRGRLDVLLARMLRLPLRAALGQDARQQAVGRLVGRVLGRSRPSHAALSTDAR